ncbi:unnamed protein product [Bursaphelenchus xylophilus]|uniref:(pine wood nematode) hypothetical protein n=1 Tax=Bursaphelenchus xylophilus TaxID=6326 RepID=A0A1I7RK07_BURXY|nr:unnamed protein product [Bursaphelenchus xylophilus]CAG9131593.1 unnamed protein product [Bursaphelenchus xylophilus]
MTDESWPQITLRKPHDADCESPSINASAVVEAYKTPSYIQSSLQLPYKPLLTSTQPPKIMSVQQIQRVLFALIFFIMALSQVSAQLGADGSASGTVLLPHGGELPPMTVFNNPGPVYSPYGFFG